MGNEAITPEDGMAGVVVAKSSRVDLAFPAIPGLAMYQTILYL